MKCIFIGGCPRSGTTMLGSMLGNLETHVTTPESQFIVNYYITKIRYSNGIIDYKTLNWLKNNFRFQTWNIDLTDQLLNEILATKDYNKLIKYFVTIYGNNIGKSPKVWIDHTPDNIKNAYTLIDIFPEAKFIHIIRDARAVASSIMPLDWGPNTTYKAAHYWNNEIAVGLANELILGDKIIRVRYEDILNNTSKILKEICFLLEIEYSDSMLFPKGFTIPKYTKKQHVLIGGTLDNDRINYWKNNLNLNQIKILESINYSFLKYFGYKIIFKKPVKKINKFERICIMIKEFIFIVLNRFKKSIRKKRYLIISKHKKY